MGILSTIAAIGVGVAGVKVYDRMKENNPQGFTDYVKEAELAAKQLYSENAPAVKEKAQETIQQLKERYPKAVNQINGIVKDVKASFKGSDVSKAEDAIIEEETDKED